MKIDDIDGVLFGIIIIMIYGSVKHYIECGNWGYVLEACL